MSDLRIDHPTPVTDDAEGTSVVRPEDIASILAFDVTITAYRSVYAEWQEGDDEPQELDTETRELRYSSVAADTEIAVGDHYVPVTVVQWIHDVLTANTNGQDGIHASDSPTVCASTWWETTGPVDIGRDGATERVSFHMSGSDWDDTVAAAVGALLRHPSCRTFTSRWTNEIDWNY